MGNNELIIVPKINVFCVMKECVIYSCYKRTGNLDKKYRNKISTEIKAENLQLRFD